MSCVCREGTAAKCPGVSTHVSLWTMRKSLLVKAEGTTFFVEVLRLFIYFRISALLLHRFGSNALCRSESTGTAALLYELCRNHRTQAHSSHARHGGLVLTAQVHFPKLEMQICHGKPAQHTKIPPKIKQPVSHCS